MKCPGELGTPVLTEETDVRRLLGRAECGSLLGAATGSRNPEL